MHQASVHMISITLMKAIPSLIPSQGLEKEKTGYLYLHMLGKIGLRFLYKEKSY